MLSPTSTTTDLLAEGGPVREHKLAIGLGGVAETLLWPLWNRAEEACRPDALINDPWSIRLVECIDYDFRGHFGKPSVFHAIRARTGDDLLRSFAYRAGDGATVVALGEGLDSQRLRANRPSLRWLSVDLPEVLELRAALLPGTEHEQLVAGSALDDAWMDAVADDKPVFISAQGLLMYFQPGQVGDLLQRVARRFPGAELYFDTIPPYFSRRTMKGFRITGSYTAPPMPWGIRVTDISGFLAEVGMDPIWVQTYAEPFPERTRLYSRLSLIPGLAARLAPGLVRARVPDQ